MARQTIVPLPDDRYLTLVGQVAYMVAYMEWVVLGDLHRHAEHLPPDLTLNKLVGKETGRIAGRLQDAVADITQSDVRSFIECGAEVLGLASKRRNDVLHARPATTPAPSADLSEQQLFRYKPKDWRGPHIARFIDPEWLEETVDLLSEWTQSLLRARV